MRRPVVAANWKMHHGPAAARALVEAVLGGTSPQEGRLLLFFPPAVSIGVVAEALRGRADAAVGAQNVYWEAKGAFTGETSAALAQQGAFGTADEAKAMLMKAVAAALREHPRLNCSYDAEAEEIIYKDFVNIGVAVDTPRGLVVPVLRDADKKPLPRLAAELASIGERARTAKFEIAELRGATFTITNVGALGGQFFTPMVNFPEVAILGLGQARLEPAVRDGQIVPRLLLPMALSFDHRVVDGADGARFVNEVIRSIENPLRLISLA